MRNSLAILFILLVSCQPLVTDIELPDNSQHLVVNCVFEADGEMKVGITRALSLSAPGGHSDDFEDVSANVVLMENGSSIPMTWQPPNEHRGERNGYYVSATPVVAGRTYDLRVNAAGYPEATATCAIPLPVEIQRVEVKSWEMNGNSEIPIVVEFDDPADRENCYEAWIRSETRTYDPSTGEVISVRFGVTRLKTQDLLYSRRAEPFDFADPVPPPAPVLFSDEGINGQRFVIHALAYVVPNDLDNVEVTYSIVLRSVSREYFENIHTKALLLNTTNDPFAQPVQVYSNVVGGFGIFAGYSQSTLKME